MLVEDKKNKDKSMLITQGITITKFTTEGYKTETDLLAVEEPLEIRLAFISGIQHIEKSISITMRTPGNDEELAMGFLFTEGIIENDDQIKNIKSLEENIILLKLADHVKPDITKLQRNFYTSSSCGVCGKSSIDAIHTLTKNSSDKGTVEVHSSLLHKLPSLLRHNQSIFDQTGGLHASALFTPEGNLLIVREDVGRHNALDKIIGAALKNRTLPLNNHLLLLSGRASFELVQKAAMAGIEFIVAVGAPSSLAVSLTKERGMTLVGFLKSDRFNIYCGSERIKN
jgi:FdhD protein